MGDYSVYLKIIFRVILSVVMGGAIGIERESKNRPAGFRTHTLVCVGSMAIMLLSQLMFEQYYVLYGITADPARLGAQVVSGVGFLGAGTIIHYGSNVKGLTTAASLWTVAAIGLIIGAGFYFLAFTVFIAISLVLLIFSKYSRRLNESGNVLEMIVQLVNKPKSIGEISLLLGRKQCEILDMEFLTFEPSGDLDAKYNEIVKIKIIAKVMDGVNFYEILQGIESINGVLNIERV